MNHQPFYNPDSVLLTSSDLFFPRKSVVKTMEGTTRDRLAQGTVVLTIFAASQRFLDLESGFARSPTGVKYDQTGGRRHATQVPLERGLTVAQMILPMQVAIKEAAGY